MSFLTLVLVNGVDTMLWDRNVQVGAEEVITREDARDGRGHEETSRQGVNFMNVCLSSDRTDVKPLTVNT